MLSRCSGEAAIGAKLSPGWIVERDRIAST
jgi:hypothetical protein